MTNSLNASPVNGVIANGAISAAVCNLRGSLKDTQGRWADAVIRFNLEPAHYAHPSWLPSWASQASKQILSSLSRHLLIEHGVENSFDWTLSLQAARLFLLEPRAFADVALALGIASHRDKLRQIVRKEQICFLRSTLGEALNILWLPAAQIIPKSEQPLLFDWQSFNADVLKKELRGTGYFHLFTLLDSSNAAERAAAMRAMFCVPKEIQKIQFDAMTANQRIGLANSIVKDIIPIQAAAWTWLF